VRELLIEALVKPLKWVVCAVYHILCPRVILEMEDVPGLLQEEKGLEKKGTEAI
jgi:hypothetical protein